MAYLQTQNSNDKNHEPCCTHAWNPFCGPQGSGKRDPPVVPVHSSVKAGMNPGPTFLIFFPSEHRGGRKGPLYCPTFPFSVQTLRENWNFVFCCLFFFFTFTKTHATHSLDQCRPVELSTMMDMFCSVQYGSHELQCGYWALELWLVWVRNWIGNLFDFNEMKLFKELPNWTAQL